MLTGKRRAELRAEANSLPVLLTVGKGGVTEALIAEAEILLSAKELVKGQVLETAMLSAREACDAICAATGADGVQAIGAKFVLYRFSPKCEEERRAKAKPKKINPVRAGAQARRRKAKEEREARNEYFKKAAIQAAIERRKRGS